MSEQTETERNEAIAWFEHKASQIETKVDLKFGDKGDEIVLGHLSLAIFALRAQSEAEMKIERIINALNYAEEGQDPKRAISIINRIVDGMADEEIMAEDNDSDDKEFFAWAEKRGKILEGKAE